LARDIIRVVQVDRRVAVARDELDLIAEGERIPVGKAELPVLVASGGVGRVEVSGLGWASVGAQRLGASVDNCLVLSSADD